MERVEVRELLKDLVVLRILDRDIRYFESLWEIPEGITYNSYVLRTKEGFVLFDTVKHGFSEEYIDALKKVVDLRDIRYVVIQHMEPDHSSSLKALSTLSEFRAEVLGNPLTAKLIKSLLGIDVKFRPVKDGDELRLSDTVLKFLHAPWLHWPETIFTYIEELKALMTCDAFGAYSIPPYVISDLTYLKTQYVRFMRKYFVNVIGHYRDNVIKALSKLTTLNLKLELIAPSHGAALLGANTINEVLKLYQSWAEGRSENKKLVILYTSMYGYNEEIVKKLLEMIKGDDIRVEVFKFTSNYRDNISDFLGEVIDAKVVVLVTSTYDNSVFPITRYVLELLLTKSNIEKPLYIITTYGWNDAASREIRNILTKSKFKLSSELSVNSLLTEADLQKLSNVSREILASLEAS
ncbi:MAG: FprA family A-type flavoprotein [Desulfurococcaceae archaeon TW002]